jgi:hypothetical protein
MPQKSRDNMKFLNDYLEIPNQFVRLAERKHKNRLARTFMMEQHELQLRNRLRNELDMMRSYFHHSAMPNNRRDEIARVVRDLEYVLR